MAKPAPLITTCFRYLFGVVLIATAVGKLLGNRGFALVLGTFRLFPLPVLPSITLWQPIPIAHCGCVGVFLARRLKPSTLIEDAVSFSLALFFSRKRLAAKSNAFESV